jgi:CPA2 family monovalent cation:H+ antiporter-2
MAVDADPANYKEAVLFLAAAGVVVPVFHRLRVSPILGFLLAGVAIGPYGLGLLAERWPAFAAVTVQGDEDIAVVAEFGVVFLLFMIGLELSFERLKALRTLVFGLGGAQVLLCAAAVAGTAAVMGLPAPAALVLGAALALSSTAIVMPVLQAKNRAAGAAGQAAFAVLLLQDLAVAPILIGLALAGRGGDLADAAVALVGKGAVLLALALALRLTLKPLMHSVAKSRSGELFLAACLLLVMAASLTAAAAGVSMALGALIAGLMLAGTEYRRAAEAMVEPFRGLLLGLFFVSVGIGLDLPLALSRPGPVLAIVALLVLGKAALVYAVARLFRVPRGPAAEAALVLAPAGEFAFVILDQATGARLLEPSLAAVVLVAVTLSMFLIPLLAAIGSRIGLVIDVDSEAPPAPTPGRPRVIVVGYGRVGRLVADMLGRHDIDVTALDSDIDRVRTQRREGAPVWFGDAGRPELLAHSGLHSAAGLVVTLDEPGAAERVVELARRLRPDLTIVARARDEDHAHRLYECGATDAVPETFEAGLQLAENTLVDVGVPMGLVIASIHEKRDEVRERLNRPEEESVRGRRSVRTTTQTA